MGETSVRPRFGILGPLRVSAPDGTALPLGGRRPRELLAILLLHPHQVLSRERLVDALWGESATDGAVITLRTHIGAVRRVLAAAGEPDALVSRAGGYTLTVARDDVDTEVFERLLERGQEALGLGDHERAAHLLGTALSLWDGEPLSDLGPPDFAATAIARLDELRLVAEEADLAAALALGRHHDSIGRLQSLVARHPFRERFVAQLMVALYRTGRQADALAAYASTKELLGEELGLDPGAELQSLETAILRQDPLVLGTVSEPAALASTTTRARRPQPADAVLAALRRSPLVGRAAELASLEEAWRGVADGGAAVALVSGPAGVGKSRLIAELAHRAAEDGATVKVARCDDASLPYQPIAAALRSGDEVADVLGRAPEPVRRRLSPLLPDGAGPPPDSEDPGRHAAFLGAVAWMLAELASDAPVLIVVEDAERIDPATAALLRHLSRSLPARSMVVIAYRDPPGSRHAPLLELVGDAAAGGLADRLVLRPLEVDDLADLVAQVTGAVPPPAFVDRLWNRTGGNPFFATEVLRDLAPSDMAGIDDTAGSVPAGVRDVLRHRLAGLARSTRDAVAAAAVLGPDVELLRLARVLDQPEERLVELLEPAIARGFLVESGLSWAGGYAFPHALMREAVYAETPPPRREQLHRRVADVLLAAPAPLPEDVMAAAVHLRRAGGAADPLEVGRASLAAAETASRALAWTEAVEHAEGALPFLDRGAPPAEQADARVRVALLRLRAGLDHARAVELLEDALRRQLELGDHVAAGTTHSRIGGALCMHHSVTDIPRALEHFDAAERVRPDIAERFHLHRGRMQAAMWGVRIDVLGEAARRAGELARHGGRADLQAYAAWGAGYHAANLGDAALAFDHFAASWQAAYSLGDAYVGWLPANAAAHIATELFLDPATGRAWCRKGLAQPRFAAFAYPHEAVADQLARAMALMGELDDARRTAQSLSAEALAHRVLLYYDGEWERSAADAADDLASNRASGNRHEELFHAKRLADSLAELGERDRALAVLTEVLEVAVSGPQVPSEVWVRARRAQLGAEVDLADARADLDRCEHLLPRDGWAGLGGEVALARATVAGTGGDTMAAETAYAEAVAVFAQHQLPWRQAEAELAWAALLDGAGRPRDAAHRRDRARAVYTAIGAPERWLDRCAPTRRRPSTRSQRPVETVDP
ncbi:DNA-binding SARP family transcriptional activator [Nocardioides thalensis]|uniref:DNA-binding SARP family transcriptional activator n=1 Tax=Nocardioides thalensis TaxID=1914755 RepID=A0A853BX35_9ACTN|nr:BTAD domain-containing putative transcriptional regulator [Nocardioides thalensis]NYI99674.1 DNA-binding SARP family transcriptional activator [Nocardioides thalensis]